MCAALQELNRLLTHNLREMFIISVFIFLLVLALAWEALPVVVFVDGQVFFRPDTVLSYKADSVSGLTQEHRVSLGKRFFGEMSGEVDDTVPTPRLLC